MESIFEYNDHSTYMKDRLRSIGQRGVKQRFAEYIRVQPAFLSQVLAQKYPLSLEQADRANFFFEHSIDESDYFIALVSRDRASTESLKKYFSNQLNDLKKRRFEIIRRLGRKDEISENAKGVYYSSWIYGAAHIATTIPAARRLGQLQKLLNIEMDVLKNILQFLVDNNLIYQESGEYLPTQNWLRLDRSSPYIRQHHNNWRQKAIQNLEKQDDKDLHFSGVYSLDSKTAVSIREDILELIARQVKKIEKAPEKELYSLGIDFFSVGSLKE